MGYPLRSRLAELMPESHTLERALVNRPDGFPGAETHPIRYPTCGSVESQLKQLKNKGRSPIWKAVECVARRQGQPPKMFQRGLAVELAG